MQLIILSEIKKVKDYLRKIFVPTTIVRKYLDKTQREQDS